jgi:hypothetical protein
MTEVWLDYCDGVVEVTPSAGSTPPALRLLRSVLLDASRELESRVPEPTDAARIHALHVHVQMARDLDVLSLGPTGWAVGPTPLWVLRLTRGRMTRLPILHVRRTHVA